MTQCSCNKIAGPNLVSRRNVESLRKGTIEEDPLCHYKEVQCVVQKKAILSVCKVFFSLNPELFIHKFNCSFSFHNGYSFPYFHINFLLRSLLVYLIRPSIESSAKRKKKITRVFLQQQTECFSPLRTPRPAQILNQYSIMGNGVPT